MQAFLKKPNLQCQNNPIKENLQSNNLKDDLSGKGIDS